MIKVLNIGRNRVHSDRTRRGKTAAGQPTYSEARRGPPVRTDRPQQAFPGLGGFPQRADALIPAHPPMAGG